MTNHDGDSTMRTGLTLGERFDAISDRMDAAYAERRHHKIGSPEYDAANAGVEAVYADLRLLNAEMKGEHAISDHEECWCEPTHVKVGGR